MMSHHILMMTKRKRVVITGNPSCGSFWAVDRNDREKRITPVVKCISSHLDAKEREQPQECALSHLTRGLLISYEGSLISPEVSFPHSSECGIDGVKKKKGKVAEYHFRWHGHLGGSNRSPHTNRFIIHRGLAKNKGVENPLKISLSLQ